MRLHVRRVIRDQGVRRGVRLVEAVARELLHVVEDLVGLRLADLEAGRAGHEDLALLRHLLGLLLAHRAAEQVGAAERVAGADLRGLHHLLLVDHDPVGRLEHAFEQRMQVFEFLAVLALDEVRNQVHRTRPVQRDERDDVLEAVGPRPRQQLAHPAGFELEHGRRVARREDPVGAAIVERQRLEVERRRRVEQLHEAQRPVEDRERREPEKVELHEPDGLDVVLVVLRDRALGPLRAVERAEVGELARRDEHAARVHADVAGHALDLLGQLEQVAGVLLGLLALAQPRLHLARHLERDELARLEGDQLREFVGAVVAPLHHAADVADDSLRGHRAEGRDLRHRLVAVLVAHVVDHAIAAVLAEVDVEVGHRDPFRIQEALEQEVVAQRIEVGDPEGVGDERAGARTPARPDGHAVRLRPADEVRDDQEVAREAHLHDGPDLELEPLDVARTLRLARGLVRKEHGEPRLEPGERLRAEVLLESHALGRREQRQLALAEFEDEVAALRDLDGVREGGRQVGEALRHVVLREEMLLHREASRTALVGQHVTLRDADARLVRLELVFVEELDRMRRDGRQPQPRREREQGGFDRRRFRMAGALELEIEPPGEQRLPVARERVRTVRVAGDERLADVAGAAARQRDQPAGAVLAEPFAIELGAPAVLVLAEGARQPAAQPQIALAVLREQEDAEGLVAIVRIGEPAVASDDGLHALAAGGRVELHGAEEIREIGDREGGHAVGAGACDGIVDTDGAVDDRVLAVESQMDEAGIGHGTAGSEGGFYSARSAGRTPDASDAVVAM